MLKRLLILLFPIAALCPRISAQTDSTIGLSVPSKLGTDYQAIASYLCLDLKTERQKANAIYNWVTHNISYDVDALWTIPKNPVDDVVEQTLKTRKGVCEGYASVFVALCQAAGLQAMRIEGYAKDWIFDNGDEFYVPRHAWCAVKVNGKWELADPTWGAGYLHQSPNWFQKTMAKIRKKATVQTKKLKFSFRYDPTYFLQEPETFRLKHLPADPIWQLTDSAMPLVFFEAGDSTIKSFNELYSSPQQTNPMLDRIAKLTKAEQQYEMADRAYAYNDRFPVVLARKSLHSADAVITKAFTDESVQNGDIMIRDAANSLKESLDHIAEQKKYLPATYAKLKRKNRAKATAAKQQIRQVRVDDKRLIADCNRHEKSITNKYKRAKKKLSDIQKTKQSLDVDHLDDVATMKVSKPQSATELVAIMDSVSARTARAKEAQQLMAEESQAAKDEIQASSALLDSLIISLTAEDSMLRNEAYARLSMHDNYDDEVITWSSMFQQQKYQTTDTLMKYYFAAFDSISVKYEQLHKAHVHNLSLYKKNVSDLERYKKYNSTNTSLKSDYATQLQTYAAAIDSASADMAIYLLYLQGNEELFGQLKKLGERQISILEFMEKAEKSRQVLEERNIAKKREFEQKENDVQRRAVQKALNQVDDIIRQIDNPKG